MREQIPNKVRRTTMGLRSSRSSNIKSSPGFAKTNSKKRLQTEPQLFLTTPSLSVGTLPPLIGRSAKRSFKQQEATRVAETDGLPNLLASNRVRLSLKTPINTSLNSNRDTDSVGLKGKRKQGGRGARKLQACAI